MALYFWHLLRRLQCRHVGHLRARFSGGRSASFGSLRAQAFDAVVFTVVTNSMATGGYVLDPMYVPLVARNHLNCQMREPHGRV